MLSQFRVSNYALLDEVAIQFEPGLNILTGETGAGKSILMGALGLILGDRASTEVIRTGAEGTTVEGLFEWSAGVESLAIPPDMDIKVEDGVLIIRREITRDGRSRCTVNGHLVTVSMLKRLGEMLVDLHGQHEHQSLLDARTHITFLDGYGNTGRQRERVTEAFRTYAESATALKLLDEEILAGQERRELYRYQLTELRDADVSVGEDEDLERERAVLTHAEQLIQMTSSIHEALSQDEGAVIDRLGLMIRTLEDLEQIDPKLKEAVEGSRSARYHLEEVSLFLQHYRDRIEFDPERLAEVQDRMDLLQELKRKFGRTLEDVCAYRDRIAAEMERIETADDRRALLVRELEEICKTLTDEARRLSDTRKRIADRLKNRVIQELGELGMEKTRFQVEITWQENANGPIIIDDKKYHADPSGMDRVEFLLSPNPGEDLKPLVNIASGGEISRIMLALKVILTGVDRIPTLVFDEVDMGIGGRIAESVGHKLKLLARSHQVLCVTHLHQVACWGDTHFTVKKRSTRGRTVTQINHLDEDGRIQEIARMLAGETVDDLAITHAREILRRASRPDQEPVLVKK